MQRVADQDLHVPQGAPEGGRDLGVPLVECYRVAVVTSGRPVWGQAILGEPGFEVTQLGHRVP